MTNTLTNEERQYILDTRMPGAGHRLLRALDTPSEDFKGEKILTTRIDFGTFDDLKNLSASHGISVSELVRRGIELVLHSHGN